MSGWQIFWACLVVAVFLAWRDEHQRAKGKPRQETLNKIVDEFHRVKPPGEPRYDWIGLLIEHSADIGNYYDLNWLCKKLDQHHYGDPFEFFFLQYEKQSFGEKKRFKFVNDARTAHFGGHKIVTDTDADNYMRSVWADENRLVERTGEPRAIAAGLRALNKWSHK